MVTTPRNSSLSTTIKTNEALGQLETKLLERCVGGGTIAGVEYIGAYKTYIN